ncbi:hypothetical protein IW01_17905 [Pectobacterium brasiliense]|uniref:Vps62-related protein n=1 Tax=Pectobacterium brasiliense TaxID=180957 RepID=UPI0004E62652|nr:Vps62-related protein [Pectobacterium brasiliense]KFF65522.1 hypothetical protein IW01_17905 [Pectobacterium brasiliense]
MKITELDIVKKFSPAFYFHENEKYFPCSIEHLIEKGTLKNSDTTLIDIGKWEYSSNTISVVPFYLNGHPHLFGLNSKNNSASIKRINDDGHGWTEVGSGKWQSNYIRTAITTYELNGKIYIWALKNNDRAYISQINDNGNGWTDIGSWKWQSDYVAVISFYLNGHPYLFGLKRGNDRAYISRINDDGHGWTDVGSWKWQSNYIGTAITSYELNGKTYLWALKDNDRAYISQINEDGNGWTDIGSWKWQSNYVSVISFYLNGHPYLFGLKQGDDRAYISRINDDGHGWTDVGSWKWQSNYIGTTIKTYKINDKIYIWALDFNNQGHIREIKNLNAPINNITQEILEKYCSNNYYIDINPSQYSGMYNQGEVTAPIYYAITEDKDILEITFPILYAYQGGQACIADRKGSEFNCILHSYGEHQGDLERVSVRLAKDHTSEYYISEVGYEAHGHLTWYKSGEFLSEGTHPVVYVALNGHASYNGLYHTDLITLDGMPWAVFIIDAINSKGVKWRPWLSNEFKQVGINKEKKPVSDQKWVLFDGRLGRYDTHSLTSATYFDGENLSALDWTYVKMIHGLAEIIDKLPDDVKSGNGPTGLYSRKYISGQEEGHKNIYPPADKNRSFLFGLKKNDEGWLSFLHSDNKEGWSDIHKGKWQSNYIGSAITTYALNGKTYIWALKDNDRAYISQLCSDGRGWDEIGSWKWQSNYVSVISFYLNGHPYLFGLKRGNDRAYICRINDDGHGWTDIGSWKWQSNYIETAITSYELNGKTYIWALKDNDRAYISQINEDGNGWTDIGSWKWQSNYIAVISFYLNGHPYLFGLKKGNNRAYISRINDDGHGWTDIGSWEWQSNYIGTAITSYELNGKTYIWALKDNDRAYISQINEDGNGWTDIGSWKWQSNYVAVTSYKFNISQLA